LVYFVCFVGHVIKKGNDMKIGNDISFTYLKGADAGIVRGVLTKRYGNIKGERSQKLVTVELEDGFHKAFYDGRMVGLEVA
jgi:sulfur transfer protein SufE